MESDYTFQIVNMLLCIADHLTHASTLLETELLSVIYKLET